MKRYILKHLEDGYSITLTPLHILMRIKNYEVKQDIDAKSIRTDDQLTILIDLVKDKLENIAKYRKQNHTGKYN
jgi:hypothetical protein